MGPALTHRAVRGEFVRDFIRPIDSARRITLDNVTLGGQRVGFWYRPVYVCQHSPE